MNIPREDIPEFKSRFDEEWNKKKADFEQQQKRAAVLAKTQQKSKLGKTLEQIQNEVEKEIDRIVFCEFIKRAMQDREKNPLERPKSQGQLDGVKQIEH